MLTAMSVGDSLELFMADGGTLGTNGAEGVGVGGVGGMDVVGAGATDIVGVGGTGDIGA
jgi:hypothetical protein